MRSFRRYADKKAQIRVAHIWTHAMWGDGRPPQVTLPPLKPKRAKREADPTIPSEHQSQAAVISWWALACNRYGLPPASLAAIPNGGARDIITGSQLKAEGVRAGFPDLILTVKRGEYGALLIEMKKGGNYPSAAQREIIAYLNGAGYDCEVCWSADEAIAKITSYLKR
jgi:hypothetical protein